MELDDFIYSNTKIWKFYEIRHILAVFYKNAIFSKSHNFFFKNEARKLKFGLVVPLNGIQESVEQIIESLIFLWNIANYVQNFRYFANFV